MLAAQCPFTIRATLTIMQIRKVLVLNNNRNLFLVGGAST